jgi:hypothetical protein
VVAKSVDSRASEKGVTRPKRLLRAIGPGLPLLLAGVGVVMAAFQLFIARPEAVRFSQQGRRVVGSVVSSGGPKYGNGSGRFDKSYCTIGVDDPELGWQVVQVYGKRPVGEAVALVCLTAARRCMTAEQVSTDLNVWPPNARLSIAAGTIGLGGILGLASRRRARTRA